MEYDDLQDHVKNSKLRTTFLSGSIIAHARTNRRELGPDVRELWEGQKLPLGQGAQGQIFVQKCIHNPLQSQTTRRVVKKIPMKGGGTHKFYPEELTAIMKFSHERYSRNFVQPLGWYDSDHSVYIAMEYLPAGDLKAYLQKHSLTEDHGRDIIAQVLEGLSIMHDEKFAHRDIKPQNVLIQRCPTADAPQAWWVKLGDFGISKRLEADSERTITSIGTPRFMAPELFSGSSSYRGLADGPAYLASDVWALGAMAFYILTKQHIFADTGKMLQYAASPDALFPYKELEKSDVTRNGQEFIKALLRPNPEDRISSRAARQHAWFGDGALRGETLPNISKRSYASSVSSETDFASGERGMTTLDSFMSNQHTASPANLNTPAYISGRDKNDLLSQLQSMGVKSVHEADLSGQTPLHKAARDGDERLASLLLYCGAGPDTKTFKGSTPLIFAVHGGHKAIVEVLLDQDVNIEAGSDKGYTSLVYAAWCGHEAITDLLLQNGANTEAVDDEEFTPLMIAVREGHEAVTRLLLLHHANTEARDPKNGFTSLMYIACTGGVAIAKLLLQMNADIRATDSEYGYTSLLLAARNGQTAIVELLLHRGANINAKDPENGWTSLIIAIRGSQQEVAKYLLDHGADIETKDKRGQKPLMMAIKHGSEAIVQLLLQKGANTKIKSESGYTPLGMAAKMGHERVAKVLIDSGVHVRRKDSHGRTPFSIAKKEKHKGVQKLLIKAATDDFYPFIGSLPAAKTKVPRRLP